jgi:hypothetical protein
MFDYLTDSQLSAQIMACTLISKDNTVIMKSTLYKVLLKSGVPALAVFFDAKKQLLNHMTIRQVQLAVRATRSRYTLAAFNHSFVNEIFKHLCRSAMFPTIAPALCQNRLVI